MLLGMSEWENDYINDVTKNFNEFGLLTAQFKSLLVTPTYKEINKSRKY